jgi:hypothetical protein
VLHLRTPPPDDDHNVGGARATTLPRAVLQAWVGQATLAVGPSQLRQAMGRIRPITVLTFFFIQFVFSQLKFQKIHQGPNIPRK